MTITRRTLAAAMSVALLVAVLTVAGPADAAAGRCFGKRATIVASGGDQPVLGTRGPDVIVGKGANDVIDGRGGNDLICGGGGDDTLAGGAGNDRLNGQSDSSFGDTLIGNGGNDLLSGGGPADPQTFVDSNDYVEFTGASGVNANLETGIATGEGTDTLIRVEQLGGTAQDDTLVGNAEFNAIWGSDGNDTIDLGQGGLELAWPGMGNDSVGGPAGLRNMVLYDDLPGLAGVTIDLGAGTATGAGNDTLTNITDAMGSVGNDTITGTSGPNVLRGCTGTDTINFAGNAVTGTDPAPFIDAMGIDIAFDQNCFYAPDAPGNTSYNGGGGIAVVCWCAVQGPINANLQTGVATGAGTDTLANIDGIIGGQGTDTLIGGPNRDFLEGTEGNDALSGGGGDDVVIAFHMNNLTVDLAAGTASGNFGGNPALSTYALSGIEDVWGSLGEGDTLVGDNQGNELFGMGGNDTMSGNQGADLLNGGDGTDIGDAGPGADTCVSIETPTGCETTSAARAARRSAGGVFYGAYSFGGRFLRN